MLESIASSSNLLEEFEKNRYQIFECLVEFTSEDIWPWTFILGEVFDGCFNFHTTDQSI